MQQVAVNPGGLFGLHHRQRCGSFVFVGLSTHQEPVLIWIFCAIRVFADGAVTPHVFCNVKLLVENGITNCAHRARFLAPEHAAADAAVERATVSRVLVRSVFKEVMVAPQANDCDAVCPGKNVRGTVPAGPTQHLKRTDYIPIARCLYQLRAAADVLFESA